MPYKGNVSDGGGKQKVSQATIDKIKKMGMTAALKQAGTSGNGEFVEGIRRMYGAKRLAAAQKAASTASRPRGAKGFGPSTSTPKTIAAPKKSTSSAPTAQQIAGNPMLAAMAEAQTEAAVNRTMIQKLAMSKVMQAMGPVLNTAARVAGPAGLAYNAYEAGQMARDTQLGQRLAQGQGGAAQQAFRSMNVPYGAGFNQGITQQQAQNILASKSARDIQAFGGTDFLRKKALGL